MANTTTYINDNIRKDDHEARAVTAYPFWQWPALLPLRKTLDRANECLSASPKYKQHTTGLKNCAFLGILGGMGVKIGGWQYKTQKPEITEKLTLPKIWRNSNLKSEIANNSSS